MRQPDTDDQQNHRDRQAGYRPVPASTLLGVVHKKHLQFEGRFSPVLIAERLKRKKAANTG
jgi:hypothetical protein